MSTPEEDPEDLLNCSDESFLDAFVTRYKGNPSPRTAHFDAALRLRHIRQLTENAASETKLARTIAWLSFFIAVGTIVLAVVAGLDLWANWPKA